MELTSDNRHHLRLKSVRVQNYKNIVDSGPVPLSNITALIGKNESGKSSFLEAINSITNRDGYDRRQLSNRVDIGEKSKTPIITYTLEISDNFKKEWGFITQNDNVANNIANLSDEISVTKYADGSLAADNEENSKYIEYLYDSVEEKTYPVKGTKKRANRTENYAFK